VPSLLAFDRCPPSLRSRHPVSYLLRRLLVLRFFENCSILPPFVSRFLHYWLVRRSLFAPSTTFRYCVFGGRETSQFILLDLYNNIWHTGNFPPSWSEATIVPLPKPDKDHSSPDSYRPIALTSCMCKTFERMVSNRLTWYLESNKILSDIQNGFRKQRSTTDQLVRLESFVREAFVRGEHVVSVFFDLEKAYDTTWKYGILKDLQNVGLKGRLPEFISNFLHNRHFKVIVGSCFSDLHEQEMGVPQGGVLSVILFVLKINSIVKCLPDFIRGSLFVDDFLICYRSRYMPSVERVLQCCLNRIEHWADCNGFRFSK
jgi:Reverse transcriptase (RNA-dependent DNA polymerase)